MYVQLFINDTNNINIDTKITYNVKQIYITNKEKIVFKHR